VPGEPQDPKAAWLQYIHSSTVPQHVHLPQQCKGVAFYVLDHRLLL
jgi:hypothetical protein